MIRRWGQRRSVSFGGTETRVLLHVFGTENGLCSRFASLGHLSAALLIGVGGGGGTVLVFGGHSGSAGRPRLFGLSLGLRLLFQQLLLRAQSCDHASAAVGNSVLKPLLSTSRHTGLIDVARSTMHRT